MYHDEYIYITLLWNLKCKNMYMCNKSSAHDLAISTIFLRSLWMTTCFRKDVFKVFSYWPFQRMSYKSAMKDDWIEITDYLVKGDWNGVIRSHKSHEDLHYNSTLIYRLQSPVSYHQLTYGLSVTNLSVTCNVLYG